MKKPTKIRELPNFLLPENSILKKHLKWLNIVSWIFTIIILGCAFSMVIMYIIETQQDMDLNLTKYILIMAIQLISLVVQDKLLTICHTIKLELVRRGHKEDIYG